MIQSRSSETSRLSDLVPTTKAGEIAAQAPGVLAQAFRMLASEPSTGVGVITLDGRILYLNDQAARIFHGPDAKAAQFAGRSWRDHMPPDWVTERLEVLRTMLVHGKPVLMRNLWRDFQHFTWISHIEPETSDALDASDADGALPGSPGADLFLTITRRAASDEEAERLIACSEYESIESGVIRLRSLANLSPRELEVLSLLGQGLSVKEVAKTLFRSEKTIERHRDAIHQKLHASDRADLVKVALRAGLTLEDAEKPRV